MVARNVTRSVTGQTCILYTEVTRSSNAVELWYFKWSTVHFGMNSIQVVLILFWRLKDGHMPCNWRSNFEMLREVHKIKKKVVIKNET